MKTVKFVDPETEEEEEEQVEEDINNLPKVPIVYSNQYKVHFSGLKQKLHPYDGERLKNIKKYLQEYKVIWDNLYEPPEITKAELLRVHCARYLRSLNWSFNVAKIVEVKLMIFMPNCWVQRGFLRPMRFQTAGSILAGKLALEYGWAINLGGGLHHCCSYRGGGFCPYADITLLIQRVFDEEPNVHKVMIIDLDAHQGSGPARDFKDNQHVYIMDMYNPHTYPRDCLAKRAIRYKVELKPKTETEEYLWKLKFGLQHAYGEFEPQLVVYNAGTDILEGDPLGHLSVTAEGVIERDHLVFSYFRKRNIPIVMLLSGGYLKSSAKVTADSILNLKKRGLL